MSTGLDILIEELNGSLWVAALSKGRLAGLEVDPVGEEVRWGSIFWAKVARIDTNMDAAFVNLDGYNIGLLHNRDVRVQDKDGTWKKGGDVAIGKLIQPGQMIAVQAKSGYLPRENEREEDKNPTVSMDIVLQGRYLLHTPLNPENRLSRRIEDKDLRGQLMTMIESMEFDGGFILRSAAADTQGDILRREARILATMWEQMQEFLTGDDPSLIMLGPDSVQRTISDRANKTINRIELTTMDHFQEAEEWCEIFAPDLVTKIYPTEMPQPDLEFGLFDFRDIVGQIDELFQPYLIMPEGAVLIIQETAALMAIDINRAGDPRSNFAINREAAAEIARQIRLRNLGGIIVIDFLRMGKSEYKKLITEMGKFFTEEDPCTVQIHGLTKAGLVEITRHRRTPPLLERFESTLTGEH